MSSVILLFSITIYYFAIVFNKLDLTFSINFPCLLINKILYIKRTAKQLNTPIDFYSKVFSISGHISVPRRGRDLASVPLLE